MGVFKTPANVSDCRRSRQADEILRVSAGRRRPEERLVSDAAWETVSGGVQVGPMGGWDEQ